MSKSVEQRMEIIEGIWIYTPEMRRIVDQMDECRERSRYAAEPRCMFISGVSGVGKSFLTHHYLHQNPRRRETDAGGQRTIIPVLSAMAPVPASVGATNMALTEATGDPFGGRKLANRGAETSRFVTLLKKCQVEMIILDECQHLAERSKLADQAADWLKVLIAKSGVPIVLVGIPYADRLLSRNAQLQGRFSLRAELAPYDWKDGRRQAQFLKFLELVDNELPFPSRSGLAEPGTAIAIYQASSGLPRLFMKLLRSAAIRAVRAGAESVRREDLAAVYAVELNHFNGNLPNPFETPPSLSQLVRCGAFGKDEK